MDVKLGVSSADFVRAYAGQPLMVGDCTYDDDDDDDDGGGNNGAAGK